MPGECPLQDRDGSREHWVPAKGVIRDNHGQVRRLGIWDLIISVMGTKHLVRYMVISMERKYLGTILPINFI